MSKNIEIIFVFVGILLIPFASVFFVKILDVVEFAVRAVLNMLSSIKRSFAK